MDGIDRLYENYQILADAGDKILEHEKEYLEILAAVKGDNNEKRLAAQFIGRFYKHFPHKAEQAIEAQLDLCEDDDLSIRKQAIKDLPLFCKDNTQDLSKIADVLTQLLQSNDNQELIIVQNSLTTLFKIDAKGALGGLFTQILSGDDIIRERAIKFLASKVILLSENILTKELQESIIQESKKVLEDVTGEEFITFMSILTQLKVCNSLAGHQALLEIVIEQAELNKSFDPKDPDCVDKLIQCMKQVIPFLSIYSPSTKFVVYIIQQVLPVLSEIDKDQEDGENVIPQRNSMEMLHLLSEMSPYFAADDNEEYIPKVFEKLLEYMPLPPPSDENSENNAEDVESKLEFTCVECLMYTLHQLCKKQPNFMDVEKNKERMKDFRLRLQYFARHVQGYMKEIRESIQKKKGDDLKSDEYKLKAMALKTTTNINTLIRDLFHNPPSYKSSIVLSWKTPTVKSSPGPLKESPKLMKRANKTPITFTDDSEPVKKFNRSQNREIYIPPSGKYSQNVSRFYSKCLPFNCFNSIFYLFLFQILILSWG
ncbi:Apoptosis inhibitor 5 [Nymphon striatum]|nr:Apoptosis inhibitor 5 [Nymphon striatum]